MSSFRRASQQIRQALKQALEQKPSLFSYGNGNAARSRLQERIIPLRRMILCCLTGEQVGIKAYVFGNRKQTLRVPDCFERGWPVSGVSFPRNASGIEGASVL